MRTCLLFISCLFFSCLLYTQQESTYYQDLIAGISKYRSVLLKKDSSMRNIFGIILNESEKITEQAKKKISEYEYYPIGENFGFDEGYHAFIKELYGDSSILSQSNINILRVIYQNYDLIDCINLDILEPRYPFKIKQHSFFFKEFEAYGIQNNEKVLLLGDSKFTLGMLSGIIFRSLNVIIGFHADYDEGSELHRISRKFFDSSNVVQTFVFNSYELSLENMNIDKIILRNLTGHVSIKKSFISSLKKSMSQNGKLIIVVQDPFLIKDKRRLKNEVSMQEKLFNNLSRSGFSIEENIKLDPYILYRFQIRGQ